MDGQPILHLVCDVVPQDSAIGDLEEFANRVSVGFGPHCSAAPSGAQALAGVRVEQRMERSPQRLSVKST